MYGLWQQTCAQGLEWLAPAFADDAAATAAAAATADRAMPSWVTLALPSRLTPWVAHTPSAAHQAMWHLRMVSTLGKAQQQQQQQQNNNSSLHRCKLCGHAALAVEV
jgi:hypothetical protein